MPGSRSAPIGTPVPNEFAKCYQCSVLLSAGVPLACRFTLLAGADERLSVNRSAGEITISFGGDTNQAAQFARGVPDFVLKGRFADLVKLDLGALEQEMGFATRAGRAWWRRLLRQ